MHFSIHRVGILQNRLKSGVNSARLLITMIHDLARLAPGDLILLPHDKVGTRG